MGSRTGTPRRRRGVTMVELVMATAILVILAGAILPSARMFTRRQREIELRRALREIRLAIDLFHQDALSKTIRVDNIESMDYPPKLEVLVEGVEWTAPFKKKYLRRIPRDPFNVAGEDYDDSGWRCRAFQDDPDSSSWGRENIFDVYSGSEGRALDGSYYKDW